MMFYSWNFDCLPSDDEYSTCMMNYNFNSVGKLFLFFRLLNSFFFQEFTEIWFNQRSIPAHAFILFSFGPFNTKIVAILFKTKTRFHRNHLILIGHFYTMFSLFFLFFFFIISLLFLSVHILSCNKHGNHSFEL